jgi:hypothetical protein
METTMTYKLLNQAGKVLAASASLGEVMLYGINNLKFYFITNAQGIVIIDEMQGRKLPRGYRKS